MDVKVFKDLDLKPEIQKAIDELGFTSLTPVQAACIPLFLKKKDVAVEAVTGSGKTLAFLVPMLQILMEKGPFKKHDVVALIVSPTRELAIQTSDVLELFLKNVNGLTSLLLIGGEVVSSSIKKIQENGCHIIVATPGRLSELLARSNFDFNRNIKALEILVLDEADKLLELGFEISLNTIFSCLPKQRQTGLFSATQTTYVEDLIRAGLRNPVSISVKEKVNTKECQRTPSTLSNFYTVCEPNEKFSILMTFLHSKLEEKHMIFFSTCASVDYFANILEKLLPNTDVINIHGKMRKKRHKIFSTFKSMSSGILLCTDVMARGVDIPDVNWVIQYDPPSSASSFVHRCGRTARIGKTGNALVILLQNETTFVNFLNVNQNVRLEEMHFSRSRDFITKVRNLAAKHREIYEKGMRAFVSYIRFYTKHECNLLFRLKDLDLGQLANSFGLIRLPKMPEFRNKKIENFVQMDVDFNDIPYGDKNREKERKIKLKEYLEKLGDDKKVNPRNSKSWSQTKKTKLKKSLIKEKKKRKYQETDEDLEDLARDMRLLRKLKRKKLTEEEFNKQFCPDETEGLGD